MSAVGHPQFRTGEEIVDAFVKSMIEDSSVDRRTVEVIAGLCSQHRLTRNTLLKSLDEERQRGSK